MDKNDFKPDTRYTITWQPPGGHATPARIYVHKIHDAFMIARVAGASGKLRKIAYGEVLKVVDVRTAEAGELRPVPAALLDASAWRDRVDMEHYSSSPQRGK